MNKTGIEYKPYMAYILVEKDRHVRKERKHPIFITCQMVMNTMEKRKVGKGSKSVCVRRTGAGLGGLSEDGFEKALRKLQSEPLGHLEKEWSRQRQLHVQSLQSKKGQREQWGPVWLEWSEVGWVSGR